MREITRLILHVNAAIPFLLIIGGSANAGDSNTQATGAITALDANQGSGVQVGADVWEDIGNALAGSGFQSSETGGSANTGSGVQNNSSSFADGWTQISSGNNGSGSQVGNSSNSNGGDRISNDLLASAGVDASVASGALDASVSGNSVLVSAASASADSTVFISAESGFFGLSGVNAVAMESGANSSQNVGVNVTAGVTTGGSSL